MSDNAERSIGALWVKTKPSGEQFFSGQLENVDGTKVSIVVFANGYKTESKHPDFKIFRAIKQAGVSENPQPQPQPTSSNEVPPPGDNDAPPWVTDPVT